MRKLALAVIAVTVVAAPGSAQDFRANRIACAKEAGASRTYYHGRLRMAPSQSRPESGVHELRRPAGGDRTRLVPLADRRMPTHRSLLLGVPRHVVKPTAQPPAAGSLARTLGRAILASICSTWRENTYWAGR